ncbi:MAG TPA: hypothetical protein VIL97_08260 [Thermoanaerobaculia bacterium]
MLKGTFWLLGLAVVIATAYFLGLLGHPLAWVVLAVALLAGVAVAIPKLAKGKGPR